LKHGPASEKVCTCVKGGGKSVPKNKKRAYIFVPMLTRKVIRGRVTDLCKHKWTYLNPVMAKRGGEIC